MDGGKDGRQLLGGEAGVKSQKSKVKSQKSKVKSQKSKVKSQKSKVKSQKSKLGRKDNSQLNKIVKTFTEM